ncbi:MAG: hypothetical protein J1D77_06890 [Muribaculaceae bacterium]|nr:hypothetical protein [Muribaculaceae bacterium]
MKILFIGDYSNLHTTLAGELRRMGHQADVMSDGCGHMNLSADFYIKREAGLLGGGKYLYQLFEILPKLKGYDVVQLINTNFLSLKPQKIKYFFDRIKEQNGSMFLSLAGNDYYYCKACYDGKILRFSDFKIGNEFTPGHQEKPNHLFGWLSYHNKILAEHIYSEINGAMAVLPEYELATKHILGDKVFFTNLPIDLSEIPEVKTKQDEKIKLYLGIRSWGEIFKGSRILKNIALEIEKDMPDKVEVEIVKDLPFKEYLSRMAQSDIVLDQLYAYSPAMTALYGMSLGKVVATGAQPEYYDYIGNPTERPILALSPFDKDIKERLINLVLNPDELKLRGQQGRKIVVENNDSKIVANKFLEHWNNKA